MRLLKNWLLKYSLPFLCVGLLLLAAINYFIFERNAPKAAEEQYISQVQKKVRDEITINLERVKKASETFNQNTKVNFSDYVANSKYPYYIFEDETLVYWSDHRYVPDLSKVIGSYDHKLVNCNNRRSIATKLEFKKDQKDILIVGLIPIHQEYQNENDYLKSGYSSKIFSIPPSYLSSKPSDSFFQNITDTNGQILFSLSPPSFKDLSSTVIPVNTLRILTLFLFVLGITVFVWVVRLINRKKITYAFILIIVYLLFSRWFTLSNSIPFIFYESLLFNPRYFGINKLTPSLGDLLINASFTGIIILFISMFFFRSNLYFTILKASKTVKSVISVFLILLATFVTYFSYRNLTNIYEKSEYFLDYSLSVNYSTLKLGALTLFILLSILFFLSLHILISLFYRIHKSKKAGFLHWLYGILLSGVLLVFTQSYSWIYVVVALYFIFIYFFEFPRFFYNFRYKTTFYFFIGAFVFTLVAVEVIDKQESQKEYFNKESYAKKYLAENDPLAEGLLFRMIKNIQEDTAVSNAINRERLPHEATSQLIKSKHLDLYFDKYKTNIFTFNQAGENLKFAGNGKPKSFYTDLYRKESYKTSQDNVFLVDAPSNDFIKQYVTFIPILNNRKSIVVSMTLRDEYAESVYPELLMDKKLVQNPESNSFSYAIFNNNNDLVFSSGAYNYEGFEQNNSQFSAGPNYIVDGYSHTKFKGNNDRFIIVSSKDKRWKKLLSDFSFLFLISVIIISLVILLYGLRYGLKRLGMNFSTKIQLYLNAAFLLPLILVIIITLSVIRNTLLKVQESFFLDNTKNATSTVQLHLESFRKNEMTRGFFEQEMNKLAKQTKVDINYFSPDGKLNFTTRPLIYEYNILSKHINPNAYLRILEEQQTDVLLQESIGELNYRAAYVDIRDGSNKSLGIVSIPFFDSKTNLDEQVSGVVNTILSVFIFLFILLLIISYFASNQLTHPLKVISQKLHKTNLDKLNEPLEWHTDDEIGVLTKSYNKMLIKFEESKNALSQSEKQTAWREMAKQVAHEIKNPLTPMKLSIQQLQRTLPRIEEKSRNRIEKALNSLTEQIDTISEIANSFSEFAKMPVPRSEVFDMTEVVQKTAYLYAQNNKVEIDIQSESSPILIRSDRQLVNRVVTNIILNGIQSVPPTRYPKLLISMYRNEEKKYAVIEIKDNGSGIPEEIKKKIFIPNFSTKVGGSGLGLAMAKRGIEHSGGNIWFESEDDKGTVFYVDIPLALS